MTQTANGFRLIHDEDPPPASNEPPGGGIVRGVYQPWGGVLGRPLIERTAAEIVFCSLTSGASVRAVRFDEGGAVQLVDVPNPQPGPEDVVVRVVAAGVCRTDLHLLDEVRSGGGGRCGSPRRRRPAQRHPLDRAVDW